MKHFKRIKRRIKIKPQCRSCEYKHFYSNLSQMNIVFLIVMQYSGSFLVVQNTDIHIFSFFLFFFIFVST